MYALRKNNKRCLKIMLIDDIQCKTIENIRAKIYGQQALVCVQVSYANPKKGICSDMKFDMLGYVLV